MGTARKTKRKYTRRIKAGAVTDIPTNISTSEQKQQNQLIQQQVPVIQEQVQVPVIQEQVPVIQEQVPVIQEQLQVPVMQQQVPVIQEQVPVMQEQLQEEEPYFPPPQSLPSYSRTSRKVNIDEDDIQNDIQDDIEYHTSISNNRLFYIACGVTVLGIILLVLGLYVLLRRSKYSGSIDAKITAASCQSGTNICTVDISYKINNTDYNQKNVSVKTLYSADQSIAITYEPTNPNNYAVAAAKWIRPVIGGSLTILAFILVAAIWFYYNAYKN